MARMHSRRKGKSGSTKPSKATQPGWVRYKPKELEMLITKLSKEGHSASEIGVILRDTYGVPSVRQVSEKRLTQVLAEKNLGPKIPEDLINLIKRAITIRKHIEKNKQDMTAKRGLQLTESKIFRLMKYYKGTGKLPLDWKFDEQSIRLYT
ncbi:MAG: 30S ribosomal protein S15 [Candidatus Woesearchaeota archaeon]